MRAVDQTLLAAAMFIALTLLTPAAFGGQRDITSVEIAQLPTFCWAQMGVPGATGPEFELPNCGFGANGEGVNHYCSGLVYMNRAKGHVSKSARLDFLGIADANISYTERAIKDSSQCSIRDHVAASRAEVNKLMVLFGAKPPKAK